ncbi:MAG: rod shape-determining protein MreC [Candidatus Magasanikbacteria bacterium]|nr:rod shape-determining protein MreC [Candidatus Magasanikbacteria bacterium]
MRRRVVFSAIIILLLIGAHALGWLKPIERGALYVISPVSRFFYNVGISLKGRTRWLEARKNLEKNLDSLTDDNARLRQALVDADLLRQENFELRRLLNFTTSTLRTGIAAAILGRTPSGAANLLIADRGKNSGVTKGSPVVAAYGVLVGIVEDVQDDTAYIRLLSDGQSKVAATTLGRSQSLGIVSGGFGLALRLDLIPQNEEIHERDLIITSGLEDAIPKGLIIGEIEAIQKEPFAPFQHARVKPATTYETVRNILILPSLGR